MRQATLELNFAFLFDLPILIWLSFKKVYMQLEMRLQRRQELGVFCWPLLDISERNGTEKINVSFWTRRLQWVFAKFSSPCSMQAHTHFPRNRCTHWESLIHPTPSLDSLAEKLPCYSTACDSGKKHRRLPTLGSALCVSILFKRSAVLPGSLPECNCRQYRGVRIMANTEANNNRFLTRDHFTRLLFWFLNRKWKMRFSDSSCIRNPRLQSSPGRGHPCTTCWDYEPSAAPRAACFDSDSTSFQHFRALEPASKGVFFYFSLSTWTTPWATNSWQ